MRQTASLGDASCQFCVAIDKIEKKAMESGFAKCILTVQAGEEGLVEKANSNKKVKL